MRAALVEQFTGPDGVRVADVPLPVPSPGDVLIDVRAAGVGFPDLLHTRGAYQRRPQPPFVLGAEVAGVVREPGDTSLRVGDRVVGLPLLGGFAQVVAVPHDFVFPLPASVPFSTGAAVISNYLTAHYALVRRARLEPGEIVLVLGAAGGLGTAATQIAKKYGAVVVAAVSNEDKARAARSAGADHVVSAESFSEELSSLTDGRGLDVVVDPVGGAGFLDSLRLLRPHGRHLVLGFASGSIPEVRLNRLLLGNIDVIGIQWAPAAGITGDYARAQWDEIVPSVVDARLTPSIEAMSLEDVREALIRLDSRKVIGKLVLQISR